MTLEHSNGRLHGSVHWGYKHSGEIDGMGFARIDLALHESNRVEVWIYKCWVSPDSHHLRGWISKLSLLQLVYMVEG
jgi:hypothetical protein